MEKYPELYKVLLECSCPSVPFWEALTAQLRQHVYLEKEIWLDQDELIHKVGFVQKGAALGFRIRNGKLELEHIWQEGDLILLVESSLRGLKNVHSIRFPVETRLLELSTDQIYQLRREWDEMHTYFDYFVGREFLNLQAHVKWIKTSKAHERILQFRESYPTLDRILTEDQKADYLGMSRRWYAYKKYP